jgi:hypothetical protein
MGFDSNAHDTPAGSTFPVPFDWFLVVNFDDAVFPRSFFLADPSRSGDALCGTTVCDFV